MQNFVMVFYRASDNVVRVGYFCGETTLKDIPYAMISPELGVNNTIDTSKLVMVQTTDISFNFAELNSSSSHAGKVKPVSKEFKSIRSITSRHKYNDYYIDN